MSAPRRAAGGLLVALLAGLLLVLVHQRIKPHRLEVWVDSPGRGSVWLEVQCEGADAVALQHRQDIHPGYQRLRLPLPACRLDKFTLRSDAAASRLAAALVSRYGVPYRQLLGEERSLGGEGFLRQETRPDQTPAKALDPPIVIAGGGLDGGAPGVQPLQLLFVPVLIWLAVLVLPRREEKTADAASFARGWPLVMLLAVVTMAWLVRTDVSLSPDEATHVTTAHYHFEHWLKPAIGAPELAPAYRASIYGISYLSTTDPVYAIAAKFAVAAWPLLQDDVLGLRLFNVLLLMWLVAAAARLRYGLMLMLPMLLMPQAWYLFGYFNGDAFPYALSTMLCLLALAHWMLPSQEAVLPARALAFGGLAGLLLLSKQNYWPCLMLLGMLWMAACRPGIGPRAWQTLSATALGLIVALPFMLDTTLPAIQRTLLAVICLVALLALLALLASWVLRQWRVRSSWMPRWHLGGWMALGLCAVVGLKMVDELAYNAAPWSKERAAAALAAQERFADKDMRPSAFAAGGGNGRYRMRSQGKGLVELYRRNWLGQSLRSGFGAYGFLDIDSPAPLKAAMQCTLVGVLVLALWRIRPEPTIGGVRIAVLVSAASVFVASALFSWTGDYQPQGRYLLSIVPMLGLGLALAGRGDGRLLRAVSSLGFLLALVSFVGVGLAGLVQVGY